MDDRDYGSRKFIITLSGMVLGTGALVFGSLMSPPEGFWNSLGAYFLLLGAGIGAYNWANLRQAQNGSAPR